jgi:hypothetical protein
MSEQLKTITIRISPTGEVTAETHGLKGSECLPYIGLLEDLLEAATIDSAYTPEFYEGSAHLDTHAEDSQIEHESG